MIKISQIDKKKDVDRFTRFPWEVYKDYAPWVPPILQSTKDFLSGKSKFFEHCKYELFMATKNGKTIATAAVFCDEKLMEHYNERIALIGYFEALPDEHEGVSQLFKNIEEYLAGEGITTVWAPFNGNIMYGVGLGADCYDSDPLFFMPYTPPYYPAYFKRNGYAKFKKLLAFTIDLVDHKLKRKLDFINRRAGQSEVKIRPMNLKSFQEDVFCLSEIYDETFKCHWGYAPQTKEEAYEMFEPFRMALESNFILFAEYRGKVIGFVLCVPNFNSVIKELNGNMNLINTLSFMRRKKKINKARLIAIGVSNEYRKHNIAPLLIARAFGAMVEKGYTTVEYSWVLEENIASQKTVGKFYGKPYKNYVVYNKVLGK